MPTDNIVSKKLKFLARPPARTEDGKRVIAYGDVENRAEIILRHIDGTILKRDVTFSTKKLSLGLVIANRRIFAVTDDSSPKLIDPARTGMIKDPDEMIEEIASAIEHLAQSEHKIRLQTRISRIEPKAGDAGISAKRLSQDMGLELYDETANRFLSFVDEIEGQFDACLLFDDMTEVADFGDESRVNELRVAFTEQWPAFSQKAVELGNNLLEPTLIFIDQQPDKGIVTIIATWCKNLVILDIAPTFQPDLIVIWDKHMYSD